MTLGATRVRPKEVIWGEDGLTELEGDSGHVAWFRFHERVVLAVITSIVVTVIILYTVFIAK